MREHPGPLDVAQKFYPEAFALRCSLYYSRNVGNNISVKVPEIRVKRSKSIVAYFRGRIRKSIEQGTLARIRQTYKSDVRKKLEFYPEISLFAVLSFTRFFGSGIGGAFEMLVPEAAVSAFQY